MTKTLQKHRLQGPIARHRIGRVRIEGRAIRISDDAARLTKYNHTTRDIPDMIIERPVAVEAPGGKIGQVQGGRSSATQAVHARAEVLPPVKKFLLTAHVGGETRGQESQIEAIDGAG